MDRFSDFLREAFPRKPRFLCFGALYGASLAAALFYPIEMSSYTRMAVLFWPYIFSYFTEWTKLHTCYGGWEYAALLVCALPYDRIVGEEEGNPFFSSLRLALFALLLLAIHLLIVYIQRRKYGPHSLEKRLEAEAAQLSEEQLRQIDEENARHRR